MNLINNTKEVIKNFEDFLELLESKDKRLHHISSKQTQKKLESFLVYCKNNLDKLKNKLKESRGYDSWMD